MEDNKIILQQMAKCMKLVSAFKSLGFVSFFAFSRVVRDYNSKYDNDLNLYELWKHWMARDYNTEVIKDIEDVLQNIKAE